MPTYGYRCPVCLTEFDVWQRMSDEPGAPCPSCGAAARRLFYPAGIVFKGAGFYATDSRAPRVSSSGSGGASDGKAPGSSSSTDSGSTSAPSGGSTTAKNAPAAAENS